MKTSGVICRRYGFIIKYIFSAALKGSSLAKGPSYSPTPNVFIRLTPVECNKNVIIINDTSRVIMSDATIWSATYYRNL
jgi:hypothetical protein